MSEKRTRTKSKAAPPAPSASGSTAPITVTGVRQEALENFAGSIVHVTAIARGECYISVKERCAACGAAPAPALDPGQLLKIVPRPAEITQANALLAKISLPTQTEDLSLAEGTALMESVLGRYQHSAIAYGVPVEVVSRWHAESLAILKSA
jgi:hypothetical protein